MNGEFNRMKVGYKLAVCGYLSKLYHIPPFPYIPIYGNFSFKYVNGVNMPYANNF